MFERYSGTFLVALGLWIAFIAWVLFLMMNMGTRGAEISGSVTDRDGQPIANATLSIEPIDIDLRKDTVAVNADGTFRYLEIGGIQPRGIWKVYVTCVADGFEDFDQVLEVEGDTDEVLIVMKPRE